MGGFEQNVPCFKLTYLGKYKKIKIEIAIYLFIAIVGFDLKPKYLQYIANTKEMGVLLCKCVLFSRYSACISIKYFCFWL